MIPGQFVKTAELPITANGKLDKSSLPAPSAETLLPSREATAVETAPSDSVQIKLSALISSLLGQPSIQLDDNFFLVGGHSMLAAQLVARVHDLFGVKLSLRQLFNAPTVAALSIEVTTLVEKRSNA
jgi:acyl carrier protein